MSCDLAKHGCIQGKTHNLSFPYHIDKSLWSHFIRGVFDGDGSISLSKLKNGPQRGQSKVSMCITGYKPFLKQINEIISENCALQKDRKIIHKKGTSEDIGYLYYNGINQCIKVRDYLYKNATVFMERKHSKFFKLGVGEWSGNAKKHRK